jgi:hypothetical protein
MNLKVNSNTMKWEKDLVKDIRFAPISGHDLYGTTNIIGVDDNDVDVPIAYRGFQQTNPQSEFSDENHNALQQAIDRCKNKPKTFLEIGVCRNPGQQSSYIHMCSTETIFKNLPTDGIYLGVDIEDRSFLDNAKRGIHTLKASSSNYEEVVSKLKFIGISKLDFIFIDGWHSINQVLLDWEYTNMLSDGGVVAFHDTTAHPGPNLFMKFLNTTLWEVHPNLCPNDHGLGYCIMR